MFLCTVCQISAEEEEDRLQEATLHPVYYFHKNGAELVINSARNIIIIIVAAHPPRNKKCV